MMKKFLVAQSKEEALSLKRLHAKSVFYAGGTEINRLESAVQAEVAIDLSKLGLNRIEEKKDEIIIGSMATLQTIATSSAVPAWLKEAALFCGSFTRRNMATIGGNFALMLGRSYVGPVLLASRAILLIATINEKGKYAEDEVPACEYHEHFASYQGALILGFKIRKSDRFVGTLRFAVSSQNRASVTVGFGAEKDRSKVRVYAAVYTVGVLRLKETESRIEKGEITTEEEIAKSVAAEVTVKSDYTGSGEYKRYIAGEGVAMLYGEFLKGGQR
jgi:putative selenate reductase FAD-binding subunit